MYLPGLLPQLPDLLGGFLFQQPFGAASGAWGHAVGFGHLLGGVVVAGAVVPVGHVQLHQDGPFRQGAGRGAGVGRLCGCGSVLRRGGGDHWRVAPRFCGALRLRLSGGPPGVAAGLLEFGIHLDGLADEVGAEFRA